MSILWSSHLSSPLQTRLKCNLSPRQPSSGRSPDKIMRLKRENIHLKIKFTIHFWACQQAGPFEIVARRIQMYFKTFGAICTFIEVVFQSSQPPKFRLIYMVHVSYFFFPHGEQGPVPCTGIIFNHCPFLQKFSKIKVLSTYLILVLYYLNIAHYSLELDFTLDNGTAIISCILVRQQMKEVMDFSDAGDNSYLGV